MGLFIRRSSHIFSRFLIVGFGSSLPFGLYSYSVAQCQSAQNYDFISEPPPVAVLLDDRPDLIKEFSWIYSFQLIFRGFKLLLLYFPTLLFLPFALLFPSSIGELVWNYTFWAINYSGPVFIKFAQWIGTRPDLFPDNLVERFSNFHSKVPVHSWKETQQTLEKTFSNWENVIEIINPEKPLGSGCMTQVYKARLKTVEPNPIVAVKVMHPAVRGHLEADLDLIEFVYKVLSRIPFISPYFKWSGADRSISEFRDLMLAQADLRVEARNLQKFAENFKNNPIVHFPEVYIAKMDVLIETFEEGTEVSDFYNEPEKIRKRLAQYGLNAFLKMLFEDNFYHADLHPGNILVRRDEKGELHIVFIDCGLAKQLSAFDVQNFQDLFLAIVQQDGAKAGRMIYERSPSQDCEDPEQFCQEVRELVNSVDVINLKLASVGHIMTTIISICKKHKVQLDGNFGSVVIAVLVLEGVGRRLDGDISILRVLTQFLLARVKGESASLLQRIFFSKR